MKLDIVLQEQNSRGQLLLRSFFGFLYILIPHAFCLFFLSIWSVILTFIAWWAILFTGRYPRSFFDYQVKLYKWNLRLTARMFHMVDDYPAIGLNAQDSKTVLEIPYPEQYSRMQLLLISFFGWLMVIPHAFCLFFLAIGALFVNFIAWWAVLITGKYPSGLHEYMVKFLRWAYRVNLYFSFMSHSYPRFSGKRDEGAEIAAHFKNI
jgi:hypothetical protein